MVSSENEREWAFDACADGCDDAVASDKKHFAPYDWLDDEYYLVIDELRVHFESYGLRFRARQYADVHRALWGERV